MKYYIWTIKLSFYIECNYILFKIGLVAKENIKKMKKCVNISVWNIPADYLKCLFNHSHTYLTLTKLLFCFSFPYLGPDLKMELIRYYFPLQGGCRRTLHFSSAECNAWILLHFSVLLVYITLLSSLKYADCKVNINLTLNKNWKKFGNWRTLCH